MNNYIKPVIDHIEWKDSDEDLPITVVIQENTYTDYHEVIQYLTDTYGVEPIAFRWRQSGLLNRYRDWNR